MHSIDITEALLWVIITLIALFLVAVLLNYALGYTVEVQGTVVEKVYTPARSSVGIGSTSSGSSATVVTSSSAKYNILADISGCRTIEEVKKQDYLYMKVGDVVTLSLRVGKWTGHECVP